MVRQINLTESNGRKVEELSRQTGKTPDEVVNDVVGQFGSSSQQPLPPWKAALMQAAGMWKDRDDIPGLMAELRRESNRIEPPDQPEPL